MMKKFIWKIRFFFEMKRRVDDIPFDTAWGMACLWSETIEFGYTPKHAVDEEISYWG